MKEQNTYDEHAAEYAQMIDKDDILGPELVIPKLLEYALPVVGQRVLDAGCGEGRISRALHDMGAEVVGIDVSRNLVNMADERREDREIKYLNLDLSDAVPVEYANTFDLVVSNLVIDDVPDYIGFIKAVCTMAKKNSRIVLSKNNPYSAVIRGKVDDYFDSGHSSEYAGMASAGVHVTYYHRTLEEYVSEFSSHGFYVSRMSDLDPSGVLSTGGGERSELYARYRHFPFLMVLEFTRM
jgi:2-polyprenyl-3-methyl-5-hydroxy-6-metoxy-1,4-benzoquinol methylase